MSELYYAVVCMLFLIYFRAADWNLAEPTWTGRLRIVSVGDACTLKLEDRNNGELFAKCPIEQYPGVALESVSDSSRYFVVRIQDENGKFFMTSFQYFIKLLYIVQIRSCCVYWSRIWRSF